MTGGLEPSEATRRADEDYGPFSFQGSDLLEGLVTRGGLVRAIVPQCVGLSLSLKEQGLTFTLVASDVDTAVLDASQYLDGGPCVRAVEGPVSVYTIPGPDRDRRWPLFSTAAERLGVRSSLSLPLQDAEGRTIGGFNLYGSTPDAFQGRGEEVAEALGAWSTGSIINRDLGFTTFDLARHAPEILRSETRLALAASLLADFWGSDTVEAEARIRRSALRARLPLAEMVDHMIDALEDLAHGPGRTDEKT